MYSLLYFDKILSGEHWRKNDTFHKSTNGSGVNVYTGRISFHAYLKPCEK
jgi:hypothetical protein